MEVPNRADLKGWRAGDGVKMPPDLSEAARSLDALPTQSCREASHNTGIAGGDLQSQEHNSTPRPVAENLASNNGSGGQFHQPHSQVVGSEAGNSGRGCSGRGAEAQIPTHFINMYYLIPALRATFASVGATDRAYSFKEILLFLKNYLFSNLHLFDPVDKLFVNCGNDPLGQALQVNRFHYDDVKPLMSKHIIRAQPKPYYNVNREHASVPDKVNERHVSSGYVTNGRTTGSVLVNDISATNGRTVLVPSGTQTLEQENNSVQHRTPTYDPIPGPSRESESTLIQRKRRPSAGLLSCTITIPDIPDSNSDAESVYSVQGYETAFCRNTEFEESEDEEEVDSETFEEYELASDDAKVEECSDDNDSVIEDVEVAVLALHALYQDEEDFWADDSDSDDQSIDNDPELVAERWDCLSCGLKNEPFVRYCGKCWQLRKNWLPDRPKKRKRKPRPKKRHSRFRSESIQSAEQSSTNVQENKMMISKSGSNSGSSQELEVLRTSSAGSAISHSGGECSEHSTNHEESKMVVPDSLGTSNSNQELELPRVSSTPSTIYNSGSQDVEHNTNPQESKVILTDSTNISDNTQELEVLPRTASSASTISFRSDSPDMKYPLDHYSSQDSGISLSQDILNDSSEELKMEDSTVKTHLQVEETQSLHREEPFSSRGGCTATTNKTLIAEVTSGESASSSRKRKSSTSVDMKHPKRLKSLEGGDFHINDIDMKAKAKGFGVFLLSSAGREWLKSPEGKLFQSSQSVQEVLMEVIEANRSTGSSGYESHEQASGLSNMCSICCLRPKNASIVHGRLTHQATCYQCARRLLDTGSRCPVCRRKIHMVCKHIIA